MGVTPTTDWRHYADHGLAPIRRSWIASIGAIIEIGNRRIMAAGNCWRIGVRIRQGRAPLADANQGDEGQAVRGAGSSGPTLLSSGSIHSTPWSCSATPRRFLFVAAA